MLFSDWICQIIAFLIVGCCFIAINYFGTSLAYIVNEMTDNVFLLEAILFFYILFAVLFTVPLLYGLAAFEVNAISGEKGHLSDLFLAFSDMKSIVRSYTLFLQCFGRLFLCFLPCIALLVFNNYFYDGVFTEHYVFCGVDVVLFLCNTLLILLLYLGIVLFSGCFAAIYLTVKRDELAVSECFYRAKIYLFGNRVEMSKTALSFLPLFVISLFSIGFLFVLYTLPYMLITLFMSAKYICDKYYYRQETANEAFKKLSE